MNVVVGISEQYDPKRPLMGGYSTSTISEVQEPHHMGRPGPAQHHLPLQPRCGNFCINVFLMIIEYIVVTSNTHYAKPQKICNKLIY